MVVDAGALGNEILKNLALLGVGKVIVARSILYRPRDEGCSKAEVAAERVREINPDCRTGSISGSINLDVGLGVF